VGECVLCERVCGFVVFKRVSVVCMCVLCVCVCCAWVSEFVVRKERVCVCSVSEYVYEGVSVLFDSVCLCVLRGGMGGCF